MRKGKDKKIEEASALSPFGMKKVFSTSSGGKKDGGSSSAL